MWVLWSLLSLQVIGQQQAHDLDVDCEVPSAQVPDWIAAGTELGHVHQEAERPPAGVWAWMLFVRFSVADQLMGH